VQLVLEQLLQLESTAAAILPDVGEVAPGMHVGLEQLLQTEGPAVASAAEVRQALGLVDVRGQPLFRAAALRKTLAEDIRRKWREWPWAPDHIAIDKLVIYTDGSAQLAIGWPRVVRTAGWSAV
jgi:hypothetical protein